MSIKSKFLNLIIISLLFFAEAAKSQDNEVILNAMRDEIKRSMSSLQLKSLQKPYYIEYKLRVRHADRISSSFGKITDSGSDDFAQLTVELRVGDYKFDNTNFFDVGLSFFGSSDDEEGFKNRTIQYELDYNTLLRELWLATDAAYKQASEIYTKKISTIKNRMRIDTTPDLIRIEPMKSYMKKDYPKFDFPYFEEVANNLSAIFRNYPDIYKSSVGIEYLPETIYFVNSEGMEYIKTEYHIGLEAAAFTQADDGMPLYDFYTAFAANPKDMPSEDSLINAVKKAAENLSRMRKAAFLEEAYSGPVLFEGQAAAEAWAQIFLPNLVTQRNQMTEGGVQQSNRYQAFQSKIGGRVLPEFLNVESFPLTKKYENTPLIANYEIDDTGIKSQDVKLVENGYIKNLLSERIPTKRVKKSNGHKRGGAAMLSNMHIYSSNPGNALNYSELKEKMIKLCKDRELPFGIIVRKAGNQNLLFTTLYRLSIGGIIMPRGEGLFNLVNAYKVYPDGKEELIRGADVNSISVQSFKDIIAVGKEFFAYNYLAPSVISPYVTGGDQYVGVSIITPDLLFEDLEIKSTEDDFRKPPIIPNPLTLKK